MWHRTIVILACALCIGAHQESFLSKDLPTWKEKYGDQIDQAFSGPLSFSHLPYARCLEDEGTLFDIAILGMPFDTAVSYRPGLVVIFGHIQVLKPGFWH
jgi:hypothetical protein